MATKHLDSPIVGTAEQTVEFIGNIIESSTEYSVIGKDLDGKILLWYEGARRGRTGRRRYLDCQIDRSVTTAAARSIAQF